MAWTISNINDGITYLNSDSNSIITKICLLYSEMSGWTIYITSLKHRDKLEAAIKNSDLPKGCISIGFTSERPHRIQTGDKNLLISFMKIVKSITENFEEIESDLSQKLDIRLTMPISHGEENLEIDLTSFDVYKKAVQEYIEYGNTPNNISKKILLDRVTSLNPTELEMLYDNILCIMPQDQLGDSILRMEEWFRFLTNPLTGRQKNCLDNVKKRADEFLDLFPAQHFHIQKNP